MQNSTHIHDLKKLSCKLGIEGKLLQLDKGYLQKPAANIIVNGEKLETFLLRTGMLVGDFSHHSFPTVSWEF